MEDACSKVPDVLLLDADKAARLLEDAGFAFRVFETRAPRVPREASRDGRLRVIRVRADAASDFLELIVCEI
ncbi:MAG: hypothetical protein LBD95_02715 [Clostridiales Family XIII bacterium]|jgi:hypothetical protein|nr:hypothetical protein [Clostridiales Family XIII bacterium]